MYMPRIAYAMPRIAYAMPRIAYALGAYPYALVASENTVPVNKYAAHRISDAMRRIAYADPPYQMICTASHYAMHRIALCYAPHIHMYMRPTPAHHAPHARAPRPHTHMLGGAYPYA